MKSKNDKNPGRQLTPTEAALHNVQNALATADQTQLHNVRTRFEGLVNAYKGDVNGTAMLHMLMAEHSIKVKLKAELHANKAPSVVQ